MAIEMISFERHEQVAGSYDSGIGHHPTDPPLQTVRQPSGDQPPTQDFQYFLYRE
jgi:hypothetical protein